LNDEEAIMIDNKVRSHQEDRPAQDLGSMMMSRCSSWLKPPIDCTARCVSYKQQRLRLEQNLAVLQAATQDVIGYISEEIDLARDVLSCKLPIDMDYLTWATAKLIYCQTAVGPFPLTIMPVYLRAMRNRLLEDFDVPLQLREVHAYPKSANLEEWRAAYIAYKEHLAEQNWIPYQYVWGSQSNSDTAAITPTDSCKILNRLFE
jgi:hypothetical protein